MARRGGLGRGLDALIPNRRVEAFEEVKKEKAQQAETEQENIKEVESANVTDTAEVSVEEPSPTEINKEDEEVSLLPPRKEKRRAVREKLEDENGSELVVMMRISKVEPNRGQPRKYFDDTAIEELADSVRQFGIIQPLLVQKKDDYYEIIAGERRWRAAQKAGLREVPVIIKNFSSQEAVEVSLIENIQREDLNPIEEAKAYERLVKEYGLSQEAVAGRVSKSRTSVTNSMRLLKLDTYVQQMVEIGELSEGHARAILGLTDHEAQKEAANKVNEEKLSVRQTEKLVRDIAHPKPEKKAKVDNPVDIAILNDIAEQLKVRLGTKVSIRPTGRKGGKIEIEYYSDDDLDRLFDMLRNVQ